MTTKQCMFWVNKAITDIYITNVCYRGRGFILRL